MDKVKYFVDFDGVILDSQDRFLFTMKDNVDPYDWMLYLSSIEWHTFLRECHEIDESIDVLKELQRLKKLRAIITSIHGFKEGREKLIYLREKEIVVPVFYVLPHQQKCTVYIPNEETVLVDDRLLNCEEWENAGGKSLLFDPYDKSPRKEKIKSLKQLL